MCQSNMTMTALLGEAAVFMPGYGYKTVTPSNFARLISGCRLIWVYRLSWGTPSVLIPSHLIPKRVSDCEGVNPFTTEKTSYNISKEVLSPKKLRVCIFCT